MPFFGIVLMGVLTFLSWKYLRIKESDKNFTGVVAHRCYTSLALVLCCGLLFVASHIVIEYGAGHFTSVQPADSEGFVKELKRRLKQADLTTN